MCDTINTSSLLDHDGPENDSCPYTGRNQRYSTRYVIRGNCLNTRGILMSYDHQTLIVIMMMRALMMSLGLLTSKMYQVHLKLIIYPRKHAKIGGKIIHCLLHLDKYLRANRLRNVAYRLTDQGQCFSTDGPQDPSHRAAKLFWKFIRQAK
jgi:hypothetical protein